MVTTANLDFIGNMFFFNFFYLTSWGSWILNYQDWLKRQYQPGVYFSH